MTDTTTTPQQPAAPADGGGQAPATEPAAPAAPAQQTQAPATSGQGGTPQQQPAGQEPKFTQGDLDRIINERLDRQQETFRKQFAAAFGIEDPNAPKDPAELAKTAQAQAQAATKFAVDTLAEAVARSAGIKPERVPMFLLIAEQAGLLSNVDLAKPDARTALSAALEAKANEFPEWKATAIAPSSGGDRSTPPDGKRRWRKSEIDAMSHTDMEKNLTEVEAAMREGRVDWNS